MSVQWKAVLELGLWTLLWLSVAFIATRHSRARVHSHHCPVRVCVCVCLFERRKAFLRDSVHHDLVVHRSADVALGAEVLGAVVCAEQTTGDQPEADVGFFGFAVQLKS